jgi:[acyl-carrier-protein] S-malonyltransferase
MAPAKAALEDALKNVEIKTPIIPVHCNVSGKRHRSPALIKQVLLQQLIKPVKWEQIMHIIFSRSENLTFPYTYEVGPGKQLGGLLYKVNKKAYAQYEAVPV